MAELLLEELRGTIRSRFLLGLLVEECLEELQPLLRATVYHLYREFSREQRNTSYRPPEYPFTHSFACCIGNDITSCVLMEESHPDAKNEIEEELVIKDEDKLGPKFRNRIVQTHDVPLKNALEEDMLCIIRSFRIDIHCVASLAYGTMYNYSKKRYTAEIENIDLDSDDDGGPDNATADGVKEGIECSELNKQIMTLMNGDSSKNITLLLYKILRILVQDRNIVYRDVIIKLIDRQCQEMEMDANGNQKLPIAGPNPTCRSVGLNTDLTGDYTQESSPKRKVVKPILAPPVLNLQKFQQTTQPFDQHTQQRNPLAKASKSFSNGSVTAQEPMVNQPVVNHPVVNHPMVDQPVFGQPQQMDQMTHLYKDPCNTFCGNQFQNPVADVPENNYPPGQNFPRMAAAPTLYPPGSVVMEELPLSLTKRPQKIKNLPPKQLTLKKQSSSGLFRAATNNPTQYMGPGSVPHRERFHHNTNNNINISQTKQIQTANVNPHMGMLQNTQPAMSNNEAGRNMTMPSTNKYSSPFAEHQTQKMNENQMIAMSKMNNLQAKPSYAMAMYSNTLPMPVPGTTPPVNQINCAMYNNRRDANQMQQLNHMGQVNPYYGSNVPPMQQDVNQQRVHCCAWDAQMHYCPKKVPYAQNNRMYDTNGRFT